MPRWSADEEERLLDAIGAGLDWTATARAVGNGRSVVACKMRLDRARRREKARDENHEELDPLHMVARSPSNTSFDQSSNASLAKRAKYFPKMRTWSGKRCNACDKCKQPDCGECVNCLDKGKFGGPNIKKKSCELRACRFPSFPRHGDHKQEVHERSQDHALEPRPTPREAAAGGPRGPPPPARARTSPRPPQAPQAPPPRFVWSGNVGHSARSGAKVNATACRECPACLRPNCGKCANCKDKRKFGGPGVKKQRCIHRVCRQMVQPNPTNETVEARAAWSLATLYTLIPTL